MRRFDPKDCTATLVMLDYRQVSRAYRIVARLPPDATSAKDVLYAARMKEYERSFLKSDGTPKSEEAAGHYEFWKKDIREWVEALGEASCHSHYLRCYAKDTKELDDDEALRRFKNAGGKTA